MEATIAQMRGLGATDADIAAFAASAEHHRDLELLCVNAVAARAFFAVSSSWERIVAPTGKCLRTGLRWADVAARLERIAACRALDDAGRDRLWEDLAVMERAALEEMARG
ncbi:MAG: hypothetical protein ACOY42_02010 [Pseudomonadota bacterium]